MALFNRNKQDDTEEVPAEIQEYYEAEKRERTWVAWLLALATLVVTILLALGLYYGGRWVYRQVFDNENTSEKGTVQIEEQREESENQTAGSATEPETQTNAPETTTPSTLPSGQPQTQGNQSGSIEDRTSSTSTSTPSTRGVSTPSTGPLPSTGPADTLAVFVITTLVAAGLHRALMVRRSNT